MTAPLMCRRLFTLWYCMCCSAQMRHPSMRSVERLNNPALVNGQQGEGLDMLRHHLDLAAKCENLFAFATL
jgi:hypothetical protein